MTILSRGELPAARSEKMASQIARSYLGYVIIIVIIITIQGCRNHRLLREEIWARMQEKRITYLF